MVRTDDGRRIQRLSSGVEVTMFPKPPPRMRFAQATDADLAHFGLPARPKREMSPGLYALWQKLFDRPLTVIDPAFAESASIRRQPRRPMIVNSPETSTNWSGAVGYVTGGELIGGAVAGQWSVPNAVSADGGMDFCSIWVGIDGDGSVNSNLENNLVQAGIEVDADGSGNVAPYAWWEWLSPWFPVPSQVIPQIPVQPGVGFETSIWLTSNSTANVYMISETGPGGTTMVIHAMTAPAGVELIGGCAEWVVERPLTGNGLSTLANYGSVEFSSTTAATTGFARTVYPGSPITMRDQATNGILSVGTIVSKETVRCDYM